MKHRRAQRLLTGVVQSLEARRLLSRSVAADPAHLGHPAGCSCGSCCGPALDEALARNGADHDANWYKPARRVTLDAGGDATPTFTTNAAGLPLLTSRADGAGLKVFLDFDGNGSNLPFGIDADDTTFNAAEQLAIYDTWRDIVSYFSPFNVNITTVQPATGGQLFAWHLTSKSIVGGNAAIDSLTDSAPSGFNQATHAVNRRSGIAHEIGHILGLSHQGEWDKFGVNLVEYTDGFGVRDASVMGIDYGTNVRNWIYGRTSSGPQNLQNDVAILAGKVVGVVGGDGFRPDDFTGATLANAYAIPANVQQIPAILERYNDVDLFRIDPAVAGPWLIDATPTYESAASPKIELLDAAGNLIASRDDADQRNLSNNDVEFTADLQPGTYYVRVSSSGDFSELGEYLLTAGPLMNGFVSADISTTIDRGGTASYNPITGVLTQLGAGTGIAGTADQFRYTYDTLNGDGSITARVFSIDNTDATAKAGIMFRASTLDTSAFVMVSITPGGQIQLIHRAATGSSATTVASITPGGVPKWLRLERTGTSFVGSWSEDGVTWHTLGSTTNEMALTALLGMATTSHSARQAAYAEFDQMAFSGDVGEAVPSHNALTPPANLTAVPAAGANTSVVLNWTDTAGETGYAIERSVDGITFTRLDAAVPADVTTYTDALSFGSMRWWYRIVAMSGSSASAPSAQASVVNKPSAPTDPVSTYAVPAISVRNPFAIYLNWADVQGDNGYRIERSTNGTTFTQIATTAANLNAYNDTAVITTTGYVYRITPITSIGDGQAGSLSIFSGTVWPVSNLAISARTASSITLSWNEFYLATGFRIERSTTGVNGWSTVADLGANDLGWIDSDVQPLNGYYYRIFARMAVGEIYSTQVAFAGSLSTTPLSLGWASSDVGDVGGWGSAGPTNGGSSYKVIGGGRQIGVTSDSFHYLYRSLVGDGSMTVRVDSQAGNTPTDNAEAGIMIRQSLNANSSFAFVNVEPGYNGLTDFKFRAATGGSAIGSGGSFPKRAPVYMRLTRAGSTFTAQASSDGSTWTTLATQTISMTGTIYIGLAVGANEAGLLSNATFSNIAITGDTSVNLRPTISSPAFATPTPVTGTTTNLSVTAADDAGEANLTYTWTAIDIPTFAPAPVFGPENGTNGGKNLAVTVGRRGFYTFRVTVTDSGGLTATSDVRIYANYTLTSLSVSPNAPTLAPGATLTFTARGLDQFGSEMPAPDGITWSASAGSISAAGLFTAPTNAGAVTITATAGAYTGSTVATVALVSQSQTFTFLSSPHSFSIQFNGDVSASLSSGDFVLTNTTTSQIIDASNLAVTWNATLNLAKVSYVPSVLPDGRYSLAIATDDVSLASGQTLSAPISFSFAFKLGDLTGDHAVNFDDLLIFAQYYGLPNQTYLKGDLNYDGAVNFDDLLIFAQRYGTSLAMPSPLSRKHPVARESVID